MTEQEEREFLRLKLKLSLNRRLKNWHRVYVKQARQSFPWATDELFAEVVKEMEAEGLLAVITAKRAVQLVYREAK